MAIERNYGKSDGLADRLDDWVARLCEDKSLPWPGMGLIDDLKAAAAVLNGKTPEKDIEPEEWEKKLEYDL